MRVAEPTRATAVVVRGPATWAIPPLVPLPLGCLRSSADRMGHSIWTDHDSVD